MISSNSTLNAITILITIFSSITLFNIPCKFLKQLHSPKNVFVNNSRKKYYMDLTEIVP